MKNKVLKIVVAIMMVFTILPSFTNVKAATMLNNPTISEGVSTWDCIWFGNYYQSNSDIKDPIKWRVLSVNGNDAFIIADQNLDAKQYNTIWENTTWETCTLRSWLNGYDASSNTDAVDYSSDNFIDTAFTEDEQEAILTTNVVNDDNSTYETDGGNDTSDKIYLLSMAEASNEAYGFYSAINKDSDTRVATDTVYAAASNSDYVAGEGVDWWLRTPGNLNRRALTIASSGYCDCYGINVSGSNYAVRPVLHVDLSKADYEYAGTVSSSGTVNLVKHSQSITGVMDSYTNTYGANSFYLNAEAKTDLNYSSSNEEVVTVNDIGEVTMHGVGEATITINAVETDIYSSATKETTVIVGKATQSITGVKSIYNKVYGNAAFSLNAKANTSLIYTSSNPKILTVSDTGKVTIKGVGTAAIYIAATGTNNYEVNFKLIVVNVNPKGTTISSLTKASKAFTVKWNKRTTQTSGYQIEYSTSSKFTNAKTVTVTSYKTTSKKIKSLKSKKKYYVRVRTYKTVNSTKYYSSWSGYKTVTTK